MIPIPKAPIIRAKIKLILLLNLIVIFITTNVYAGGIIASIISYFIWESDIVGQQKRLANKDKVTLFGKGLELPPGIIGGAHIELFSNREMVVDGCKGIMEYSDSRICLNIGKGSLTICGSDLQLTSLGLDNAVISGTIVNVEFCM